MDMRTFVLSFLLLSSLSVRSFAQSYHFQRYGTSDGLSQNFINALAQDHRGFLWIGTEEGGLNRFDGREVIVFDPHSSGVHATIRSLAAFGDHLFIGTHDGMQCLSFRQAARNRVDTTFNTLLGEIRGPVGRIEIVGSGALRISTDSAVWLFSPEKKTLERVPDEPREFSHALDHVAVRHLTTDCKERAWFATDHGLYVITDDDVFVFNHTNGLAVSDCRTVLADREGNIWVGTSDGLFRHTPDRITTYAGESIFAPGTRGVWRIAEAPDGSKWFGTIGGGAVHLSQQGVRKFTKSDGLPTNDVADIHFTSDGKVLFATHGGLAILDGEGIITMTTVNGLPDNRIEYIVPSVRGWFWLSTHSGLAQWNGKQFKTLTTAHGLPSNRITQVAEDHHGDVWIGTQSGAATISRSAKDKIYPVQQLSGIRIASVFIDRKNRPWFGTVGSGAYFFERGRLVHLTRNDGLAGNTVYFISQDRDGMMYLGTNAGVSMIQEADLRFFIPEDVSEEHGSHFSVWYPGVQDISTAMYRTMAFHTLRTTQGLAGNEMNAGAVMRDSMGNMWFGAIGGASMFVPIPRTHDGTRIPTGCSDQIPLSVLLTSIRTGRGPVSIWQTIELDASDQYLRVTCVMPSFRNPGEVRIYYRLEGMEFSWHEATNGEIFYTSLPPGEYELAVLATIGEGIWTRQRKLLAVIVHPPFHQTAWFWLTIVLGGLAAGYGLHLYRSKKLLELERVRTRIAADLHDAIGASLSSISLLGDVEARRRSTHGETDTVLLTRMRTLAREAVQSMSEIVWAVNPARDNVRALAEKMREFTLHVSSDGEREISFSWDERLAPLSLHADARRHLLHLFQEAFNNAVKHSGAQRIDVSLQKYGRGLHLSVEDNGHGFDVAHAHAGNGLSTMHMRAKEMNWDIDIDSSENGTRVSVMVIAL